MRVVAPCPGTDIRIAGQMTRRPLAGYEVALAGWLCGGQLIMLHLRAVVRDRRALGWGPQVEETRPNSLPTILMMARSRQERVPYETVISMGSMRDAVVAEDINLELVMILSAAWCDCLSAMSKGAKHRGGVRGYSEFGAG